MERTGGRGIVKSCGRRFLNGRGRAAVARWTAAGAFGLACANRGHPRTYQASRDTPRCCRLPDAGRPDSTAMAWNSASSLTGLAATRRASQTSPGTTQRFCRRPAPGPADLPRLMIHDVPPALTFGGTASDARGDRCSTTWQSAADRLKAADDANRATFPLAAAIRHRGRSTRVVRGLRPVRS